MKRIKATLHSIALTWLVISIAAFFGIESLVDAGETTIATIIAVNLAAAAALTIGTTPEIKKQ